MSEPDPSKHGDLSPQQRFMLNIFCTLHEAPTIKEAAAVDQASSEMRDDLSRVYDIKIRDEAEYYYVVAGAAIAAKWMAHLIIKQGLPPDTAAEITKKSAAGLRPGN